MYLLTQGWEWKLFCPEFEDVPTGGGETDCRGDTWLRKAYEQPGSARRCFKLFVHSQFSTTLKCLLSDWLLTFSPRVALIINL